jgi:hypothetical protein
LKSRSKVSRKIAETIKGNKMYLTPGDLAITAAACRGLAERYRDYAQRHKGSDQRRARWYERITLNDSLRSLSSNASAR